MIRVWLRRAWGGKGKGTSPKFPSTAPQPEVPSKHAVQKVTRRCFHSLSSSLFPSHSTTTIRQKKKEKKSELQSLAFLLRNAGAALTALPPFLAVKRSAFALSLHSSQGGPNGRSLLPSLGPARVASPHRDPKARLPGPSQRQPESGPRSPAHLIG